MIDPPLKVWNGHNSFTLYTALCAIQILVLSFGVELLDRSVIHLLLQKMSVNLQLLLCFWLHIVVVVYYTTTTSTSTTTRKDKYKRSLVSNIKRLILKQITFTARCSVMADLYIYIYMKTPIVKQISFTPTCSAMENISLYILKNLLWSK